MDSLVADVVEDLHDTTDLYVPDVDLLMVDMAEDLHVSLVADLSLHVANMDFMFEDIVVSSCDQLQRLLARHYVQFVLGSAHADWMIEIIVFDSMMQMWMMCRLLFLSLLEWKPLVKMKMVFDLSLGIKVWDILFYLLGESDAGELSLDFSGLILFMVRDFLETH